MVIESEGKPLDSRAEKPFDKCRICYHTENVSDPCPPIANRPLAQTKEELIEHLTHPIQRPIMRCEYFKVKEEATHNDLADYIQSLYDFKTMRDTHEIYYFNGGIYVPHGEELIIEDVEKSKNPCAKTFMNEVLNHIQARTFTDREKFDQNPSLICLENGVLDLETMTLHDHDPSFLFLNCLPIFYDPDAKCPNIDKFLSEIVSSENLETLKELFGYVLEPTYFIRKAFMLIGEGANGKSTYNELITRFAGKDNCSHESLQNLIYSRFSPSELYGKTLNTFNDISNLALKQTGVFKGLCGGDRLKGEKKFKNPFYFYNRAKLVFSTNTMPESDDVSNAYFERWIIIPFPIVFDDSNPNTVKTLIEKLSTKEELSGLLNMALEKLKQLKTKQKFSDSRTMEEIKEYYMKLSKPIYAFKEECLIDDSKAWITKEELYNAYLEYCDKKKLLKPRRSLALPCVLSPPPST
jgi:putative DNA primase/helicase